MAPIDDFDFLSLHFRDGGAVFNHATKNPRQPKTTKMTNEQPMKGERAKEHINALFDNDNTNQTVRRKQNK